MMAVPHVSVIVPNYNHARFLAKRMESVLSQTLQDFEVIVLDDASTDDSREVIRAFADDPRVRVISNQENSGSTFKQWNKGMREARGEYMWIAESDDYADLRLLETLLCRLEEQPNAGMAYCQSCIVDEHSTPQGVLEETDMDLRHLGGDRWLHDYVGSGSDECLRFLLYHNTIANASAVVFRRSLAEKVGFADESFKICGDWLFWAGMMLETDVAFVAQPLNYFRRHGTTVRAIRTTDGYSIEESYRVISFLASKLDLDDSILEPIRESYCGAWLWDAWCRRIGLRRQAAICRAARKVDPRLTLRCARLIFGALGRFLQR